MKFGSVPIAEAEGCILAHSIVTPGGRLRKGLQLSRVHLDSIEFSGQSEVVVAQLESGDVLENAAAQQLAEAIVSDPEAANLRLGRAFTGRVNVMATAPGVVQLDVDAINAFNGVNPMITIATVPPMQQMKPGGMVATIKIISYAVSDSDIKRAGEAAADAIRLIAPRFATASLIMTSVPGGPGPDKAEAVTRARLSDLGMTLEEVESVPHRVDALSFSLQSVRGDIVLVLPGSATSDIADVAPAAVVDAGGQISSFGLPVDPGNLLFFGDIFGRPVIGLPGCARSPALNGADWILSRIACGLMPSADDIAAMGVGGLLKEIPTRPQPRAG